MGSSILYYDHDKSQWVPGVLVEKIHDRSYVIISQKGRKVTRNRIDIKPYPGKVQVHFETPKVPMTSPTIMSKQASSSSHRPHHHHIDHSTTITPLMQMQHQPHHQLHHQANHQCHCPKYKLKLYHHIMTQSLVVLNREILSITLMLHSISQASSFANNQPKVPKHRGNWLLQLIS